MTKKRRSTDAPLGRPAPGRFVATIYPGRGRKDFSGLEAIALDRLPDPDEIRVLVTAADCAALLDAGFEVRLHHHYPIEPVDPTLIASDKEAKHWLAGRLAEIRPDTTQPNMPPRRRKA